MKRILLVCLLATCISGCSCKEWGYCAHIFPNAERFAENDADTYCTRG